MSKNCLRNKRNRTPFLSRIFSKCLFFYDKIENIINPLLKSKIDQKYTCCSVYQFKCLCQEIYVGESKKILEFRVFEHRRDVQSHIKLHIDNCTLYQDSLFSTFGPEPILAEKLSFLLKHFSLLEKNLTNTYIPVSYTHLTLPTKA